MGARLFSPRTGLALAAEGQNPSIEAPKSSAKDPKAPAGRNGRLFEAAALLLFAGAAFITLALATYRTDSFEPSAQGSDWMGPTGAFVAGIAVQAFGVVAWLVPIGLALLGAPLFRGQRPAALGFRIAGDLLIA